MRSGESTARNGLTKAVSNEMYNDVMAKKKKIPRYVEEEMEQTAAVESMHELMPLVASLQTNPARQTRDGNQAIVLNHDVAELDAEGHPYYNNDDLVRSHVTETYTFNAKHREQHLANSGYWKATRDQERESFQTCRTNGARAGDEQAASALWYQHWCKYQRVKKRSVQNGLPEQVEYCAEGSRRSDGAASTGPNSFELCRVASELDDSQTEYWLDLLHETKYLDDNLYKSINDDCAELIKILTAIIKKIKEDPKKK